MPLVNTNKMFADAYERQYAVGAFNVDSIAMIQAVLQAAEDCKSPVIISLSKGSREFMHPGNIKEQILCVSKDITIPFAIHLDHGKGIELCKECIDEGFTSVMIDASAYDFEENIRITKEVVDYAHERNVSVEGELSILTNEEDYPSLIEEFVKRTNVDSLAISIGTGHGTCKFKKGEIPNLKFDILDNAAQRLPSFPFILHGSSSILKKDIDIFNNYGGEIKDPIGIPEELLRIACSKAVCKINIGTDFRVAYVGALRKSLGEIKNKYEPRNFLVPAKKAAQELVEYKMKNVFNSAFKVK